MAFLRRPQLLLHLEQKVVGLIISSQAFEAFFVKQLWCEANMVAQGHGPEADPRTTQTETKLPHGKGKH